MIDRHLQSMLLRERGDNRKLAEEVLETASRREKAAQVEDARKQRKTKVSS